MAKTVTSWKNKKNYVIQAPENFENKELGITISSSPEALIGRTVDTSLGELIGDRSKQTLKLVFEVTDVKGEVAHTRFKRFFMPEGFLRSKVRKGVSKFEYMTDLDFKDEKARFNVMILSRHRISAEQKSTLSRIIGVVVEAHKSDRLDNMVQLTLFGKLGTEIYKKCKAVLPIARVEVYEIYRIK